MFSKLGYYRIMWYLFIGFKIILCSVYSVWFVKYVFSVKIWFVKTSAGIVKYESQVIKSNPVLAIAAHIWWAPGLFQQFVLFRWTKCWTKYFFGHCNAIQVWTFESSRCSHSKIFWIMVGLKVSKSLENFLCWSHSYHSLKEVSKVLCNFCRFPKKMGSFLA